MTLEREDAIFDNKSISFTSTNITTTASLRFIPTNTDTMLILLP